MWVSSLLNVALLLATANPTLCKEEEMKCETGSEKRQKTIISISSKKSEGGDWGTQFSAKRNGSLSSDMLDLDLTQEVAECLSYRIISIQGEVKGTTVHTGTRSLLFHKLCSPNAAITNGGRSLQKYKEGERATALTERPLMDEEIFRVRLDKRSSKYPFGIGVTSHSPGSINILDHINDIKSGTWLFYNSYLYINSSRNNIAYIKPDFNNAKAGDVFGVMRSKFGSLHLFVNGIDLGPAAPVPENVYGAFELYDGGLEATIVN